MLKTIRPFNRSALIAACTLLGTLEARADFYLSLEMGQALTSIETAHFQSFNQSIIEAGGSASLSENDSGNVFLLGVGYRYSPNLSVEAGYLSLGEISATSRSQDTLSNSITRSRSISEKSMQKGVTLSAVGHYPLNEPWTLNGLIGVVWLDQTTRRSANGESVNAANTVVATESESYKETSKQWAPIIGVSTSYHLTQDVQLNVSLKRIAGTEPGVLGEQDLNLLTAGINISL